ncbi:efflux transporter periplasmic adaptor subunit [Thioclava sp. F42-5]|uniref:efflux RND transporter periplasmic adaptor subunit n=1 Tax=Thioclava sp. F42-5 TaxID=1973005 RepID=UPI000B546B96|nr:efflux RND transporter periplasmic adaptor subunit [Thioclava sp. F42-5]OWY08647.1 efflux transporter periplasmic adaptor subunit [Thioclava sp. F42-5]
MIKRLLIALVALILVVGGVVGYNLFRSKMIAQFFANMKQPPVAVSVSEVKPITWEPGLEAIGTAAAVQGTELAVEMGGTVQAIHFEANDKVEKGEVLLQIDDSSERADLASAKAAQDLAETNLKRARQLADRGVSATSNLDQAEASAQEARASVAKLQALLEKKRLTAPFAGIIGIPRVEVGQYVGTGTTYATLQDRDHMRVDFTLSEQQARLAEAGQTVKVQTEDGSVDLKGEITGIEPKIDPNSRLVTLRAEVPNGEGKLTPGQFVHVTVVLPAEDNVIALPQTVVSSNLYGDSVYVVRKETPEGADKPQLVAKQVFITLGRRSGQLIEVTKGLKAGDMVVNAGQNKLNSGATVSIDNAISPDPDAPSTEEVMKAFGMEGNAATNSETSSDGNSSASAEGDSDTTSDASSDTTSDGAKAQ